LGQGHLMLCYRWGNWRRASENLEYCSTSPSAFWGFCIHETERWHERVQMWRGESMWLWKETKLSWLLVAMWSTPYDAYCRIEAYCSDLRTVPSTLLAQWYMDTPYKSQSLSLLTLYHLSTKAYVFNNSQASAKLRRAHQPHHLVPTQTTRSNTGTTPQYSAERYGAVRSTPHLNYKGRIASY